MCGEFVLEVWARELCGGQLSAMVGAGFLQLLWENPDLGGRLALLGSNG